MTSVSPSQSSFVLTQVFAEGLDDAESLRPILQRRAREILETKEAALGLPAPTLRNPRDDGDDDDLTGRDSTQPKLPNNASGTTSAGNANASAGQSSAEGTQSGKGNSGYEMSRDDLPAPSGEDAHPTSSSWHWSSTAPDSSTTSDATIYSASSLSSAAKRGREGDSGTGGTEQVCQAEEEARMGEGDEGTLSEEDLKLVGEKEAKQQRIQSMYDFYTHVATLHLAKQCV